MLGVVILALEGSSEAAHRFPLNDVPSVEVDDRGTVVRDAAKSRLAGRSSICLSSSYLLCSYSIRRHVDADHLIAKPCQRVVGICVEDESEELVGSASSAFPQLM